MFDDFKLEIANRYRGYGLSIFSLPIFWVFNEHSTWPIKILFHLWGIGSAILTFLIAWEISKKEWFALITGIFVVLLSDLPYYGNYLLSWAPAAFFVSLFAYFMVKYFITKRILFLYSSGIISSAAVFIRPEYVLLVGVFGLFTAIEYIQKNPEILKGQLKDHLGFLRHFVISVVITLTPLFILSWHNYKNNGFFGLTDFTYAVVYEGTIHSTYKVRQDPPLVNPNSPAVQEIQAAITNVFPELVSILGVSEDYPKTGLNWYRDSWALKQNGYSLEEIKELSYQAVLDTVTNQPLRYLELIILKVYQGLRTTQYQLLESDSPMVPELQRFFTDNENPGDEFTGIKELQILIYKLRDKIIKPIYYWRLFSFISLFYFILNKDRFSALGILAAVAFLTSIFPLILGLMSNVYTVPGAMLMYTIGLYSTWKLGKKLTE